MLIASRTQRPTRRERSEETYLALAWLAGLVLAANAAGRLSGKPKESTAAWHGLVAWALTALVVFYLLTSAVGGILGGAFRTMTSVAGNVASTAGGAVQTATQAAAPSLAAGVTDPFSSIEQAVRSAAGGNDPATLRDAATTAVRATVTGDQGKVEEARERAAQAIAKAQNIPVDQARTQVQQYEQQYRETVDAAKRKATEAADLAAKTVSRGALFGSLALLLGALAGWFGGRMGAVEPTLTAPMGFTPSTNALGHARPNTNTPIAGDTRSTSNRLFGANQILIALCRRVATS